MRSQRDGEREPLTQQDVVYAEKCVAIYAAVQDRACVMRCKTPQFSAVYQGIIPRAASAIWRRRSPADLRKRAPNTLYNNNNKKLGVANCAAKCAANFSVRSQAYPQLTVVELFPGSASKCKSGPDYACARVMAAPKRESDEQVVGGSCRLQAPTRRRATATEG